MAEENDRASKTEAPTQRRLDEARKKGDVAKSQDVPALMALAGASGVLLFGGGWIAKSMAGALLPFIDHPASIELGGGGAQLVARAALAAALPAVLVLAVAGLGGAAGNLIQHGLMWAPSKLAPEFSKLNPLEGMKRLFGLDALVAFIKSLLKVGAVAWVAWLVLKPRARELEMLATADPLVILPFSTEVLRALLIAVLVLMVVVAGFDWFWTRYRFMQRMRMSREEVKQDHKETEGDPHVKGKLKQMRIARSRRRMIQNVPKATVVVMNPTHYAVALRYEQGVTAAPVCVAKGVDALALKIRAIAEAHEVPVIEDPPLARALYASIDVDEVIPQEHYQAVAKIIGFILSEGRKAAARPTPAPARA